MDLPVLLAILLGAVVGLGLFVAVLAVVGLPERPAGKPTRRRRPARDRGRRTRRLVLGIVAGGRGARCSPAGSSPASPSGCSARSGTASPAARPQKRVGIVPPRGARVVDRVAARHHRRRGRAGAGDPGDRRQRRRTDPPVAQPARRPVAHPRTPPGRPDRVRRGHRRPERGRHLRGARPQRAAARAGSARRAHRAGRTRRARNSTCAAASRPAARASGAACGSCC